MSLTGISGHARLLPYLESKNLYERVYFALKWNDPLNANAAATKVAVFVCPSDGGLRVPSAYGANNYYMNQGSQILYGGVPPTNPANGNFNMPPADGVFYSNSFLQLGDIRDGLSLTVAFAEKVTGDFSNAVSTEKSDTFQPGIYPADPDQAYAFCQGVDVKDLTKQGYSNVGGPWLQGYHSTTLYYHVAPPNGRSCMYPPGRIMTTANSYHPGGVQGVMCDGSVQFFSETIDVAVWRSLGTRAGDEAFQIP